MSCREYTLRSKGDSRETEVMLAVLVRNDGGLDHRACSGSSKEQLQWRYILKVEQTGTMMYFM